MYARVRRTLILIISTLFNLLCIHTDDDLDGPLPKMCPAVVLSHQDGCRSAVALLLKAALIQVGDYRLLGASGLNQYKDKFGNRFVRRTGTLGNL
jgi:hypothetical protein